MQTITKTENWIEPDWELLEWAWDLEKQWKETMRKEYPRTDAELIKIFRPSRQIFKEKIFEEQEKRDSLVTTIKKKLTLVKHQASDESSQWFWREWIKVNEGNELVEIDKTIGRLKRQLFVLNGRTAPKGAITQEMIEQAQSVPIETVINQQLKKSGNKLVGLCQLHQEKSPSFFVYPESNSFYCYGCGVGGNVINLIKLLHGFNFIEAVKFLTNNQ